jgi:hypothetical protein
MLRMRKLVEREKIMVCESDEARSLRKMIINRI